MNAGVTVGFSRLVWAFVLSVAIFAAMTIVPTGADGAAPPTIAYTDPLPEDPAEPTPPPPLQFGGWNTGVRAVWLDVNAEAGIEYLDVRGGRKWYRFDPPVTGLPSWIAHFDLDLVSAYTNRGLNEGTNMFTAKAYDSAGNVSELLEERSFKIDNFIPVTSDFHATSDSPWQWQSSPRLDLAWVNLGENEETSLASGVVKAQYRFFAPTSVWSNPLQPVTINRPMVESVEDAAFPGPGMWRVTLYTWDRAGNRSDSREIRVGYDPVILDAPVVDPIGMVGDLESHPRKVAWSPPSNLASSLSGLCGYSYAIDRKPDTDPGSTILRSPGEPEAPIPDSLVSGTYYLHVNAISCAAQAGHTGHAEFRVDRDPPKIEVSPAPPGGWYDDSQPLRVDASDAAGGPVSIGWAVGSGAEQVSVAPSVEPALPEGISELRLRATDEAGNEARRTVSVRVDRSGPTATFAAFDHDDPTLVESTVVDPHSGVQYAVIEYRAAGAASWQTLAIGIPPTEADAESLTVRGRVSDDKLPAGTYDLRLIAIDRAGHRGESHIRVDGSPAVLTTPLRGQPEVTAGFAHVVTLRKCRRTAAGRRVCRTSPQERFDAGTDRIVVGYRDSRAFGGEIVDSAGRPMAGVELEILEWSLGGVRRRVATISTGADGSYRFKPGPGPSRRFTVRFGGSNRELPIERDVKLYVRSAVSLRVTPTHARPGHKVRLSGRVHAMGATFPRLGKLVSFEYAVGQRWKSFGKVEARASSDGRFSTEFTIPRDASPVRYRLRAVVPFEEGWQYESGRSRGAWLTVG